MKTRKFRYAIFYLLSIYKLPFITFAQEIDKSSSQILVPNSKLELLFDGGIFTEGPAVGPDGNVYFSDITISSRSEMQAGNIWKYDINTKKTSLFRSPSGKSNGIIFDLKGNMIAALGADFGGRSVIRTNMKTGKSVIIAGTYKGKSLNSPNDLTIEEKGEYISLTPDILGMSLWNNLQWVFTESIWMGHSQELSIRQEPQMAF